jgi:hypothetical protein
MSLTGGGLLRFARNDGRCEKGAPRSALFYADAVPVN